MKPGDIKRIRSMLGWSQERLARELGVSFCTVNRWERGKTTPSPMGLNALKAIKSRATRSERRKFLRSPVRFPVALEVPGDRLPGAFAEKALTGFTEDMSRGGLLFSFASRPPLPSLMVGDAFTFRLLLGDGRWAQIPSVVRWTAATENRVRAGVMYAPGVSGETMDMIAAVLPE